MNTKPDPIQLYFKKGKNDQHSIRVRRMDGSETWSRVGSFFIYHDLAHYAIETGLKRYESFYSMLAGGMDITDFESQQSQPKPEIPAEAIVTEFIVNLLMVEWNAGRDFVPFTDALRDSMQKSSHSVPEISDDQIRLVRQHLNALVGQWHALEEGGQLELEFPRE